MNNHEILYLIQYISKQLKVEYTDSTLSQQYAWWLLQKLCKKNKNELIIQNKITINTQQTQQLQNWINDLITHKKPIQYILGSVPFNDLEILVEPPILIPRPETEEWCYNLIEQLKPFKKKPLKILDLATGSGCIALALARHLPNATITATDISHTAVALTLKNKTHNGITNVRAIQSDLFDRIPSSMAFDLIIANPPYIAESERDTLDKSVIQWEDPQALFSDDNGLCIIKKIIKSAPRYIAKNNNPMTATTPHVIIEIGWEQGEIVKKIMLDAGYNDVYIHKDLEKKDRIVVGRVDCVANTNP